MTAPLISRNPATGAPLAEVAATEPSAVAGLVDRARRVQPSWAALSWRDRRSALARWHRELARRADVLAEAVRDEVGKPAGEAMAAEVVPSLDALLWTVRTAGRVLASRRVGPRWQRLLLMPPARVERRAVGVVGVLGAWNYPILLNAPVIAHAIAAGNAVVWKPSELSARCGALLQETIAAAALPDGLVAIVQGGPEVGGALVESPIDLAVFTGGIGTGRRVLATLGSRGVPAVAELSGFDAAVVLPDAPMERTARALLWSAFVGAGQTCTAVKRAYVVAGDADAWADRLRLGADALRVGDPAGAVDVGPMISASARDHFHSRVQSAIAAGARLLSGGEPLPGPGWFYRPTVLIADAGDDRPERALEGCFGPVVIVRGVADTDEAVAAVNGNTYGLSASVWGRDRRAARAVAERLDAGVVGVNEAVAFFAHASAPVGGVKASGHGRVHGAEGLLAMTVPRTIVGRSSRSPRPQLFPYDHRLGRLLAVYRSLVHRG